MKAHHSFAFLIPSLLYAHSPDTHIICLQVPCMGMRKMSWGGNCCAQTGGPVRRSGQHCGFWASCRCPDPPKAAFWVNHSSSVELTRMPKKHRAFLLSGYKIWLRSCPPELAPKPRTAPAVQGPGASPLCPRVPAAVRYLQPFFLRMFPRMTSALCRRERACERGEERGRAPSPPRPAWWCCANASALSLHPAPPPTPSTRYATGGFFFPFCLAQQ